MALLSGTTKVAGRVYAKAAAPKDAPSAEKTEQEAVKPDPTRNALVLTASLVALGTIGALVLDAADQLHTPFDPAASQDANFALFAGFYVAAQVIERLGEIVAPFVPWWSPPAKAVDGTALDDAAKVAHTKADRGMVMLGFSFLLGVVASSLLGLYFFTAIGVSLASWVDVILTAITISGGTNSLHGLIGRLQKPATTPAGSK